MANQRGTIHTFGPEKKLTIVTNTQGIGSDKRRIATVVVILQWMQAVTVLKKSITDGWHSVILPANANLEDRRNFITEITLMKEIGKHLNIVSMLGCVTSGGPLCLITEFCPHGDLRNYLRLLRDQVRGNIHHHHSEVICSVNRLWIQIFGRMMATKWIIILF